MSDKVYRLLERHQKLDALLRQVQVRWLDPLETSRIKKLKLAVRDRLSRLARQPKAAR